MGGVYRIAKNFGDFFVYLGKFSGKWQLSPAFLSPRHFHAVKLELDDPTRAVKIVKLELEGVFLAEGQSNPGLIPLYVGWKRSSPG